MGFMEYSSMWDDKENCLYSFDNKNITHRESLIRTRNFSPGLAFKFFSLIENYQFNFSYSSVHKEISCYYNAYHDITMHIILL